MLSFLFKPTYLTAKLQSIAGPKDDMNPTLNKFPTGLLASDTLLLRHLASPTSSFGALSQLIVSGWSSG